MAKLPINGVTTSLAVQADGKILAGGYGQSPEPDGGFNYDFSLVRLLPNGNLDLSFGVQGVVGFPIGST